MSPSFAWIEVELSDLIFSLIYFNILTSFLSSNILNMHLKACETSSL